MAQMRVRRFDISLCWLLGCAALFSGTLIAVPNASADVLAVGAVPADYLGKTLDSEQINLSRHKGQVVLVTFWAAWCPPCVKELPMLDLLQKRAGDRIRIIAVNVRDTRRAVRYITDQLPGSPLIFTLDKSGAIAKRYGVESFPNLFVIDQAGVVSATHVGFDIESFRELLEEVIGLLRLPVALAPAAETTGAADASSATPTSTSTSASPEQAHTP